MSSPTGNLLALTLPSIGDCFMYIETSSDISGDETVFVSFERTDFFHFRFINFHLNPLLFLCSDSVKSMRRFSNRLLTSDIFWSKRYNVPKMIDVVIC